MCVDLSHLNHYVKREKYQPPTPAEAIADISAILAKFFTVLDAMNDYHQCTLNQESQLLTTFIMPFGHSSICMHYMEFPPYLSIMINVCMKLLMASWVSAS